MPLSSTKVVSSPRFTIHLEEDTSGKGWGWLREGKCKHNVYVRAQMEIMRMVHQPAAVSHAIQPHVWVSRLVYRLLRYWPSKLLW